MKLIIIILLSFCLLVSGCVYDKAHTIKTNSDVCGEFCFYQAKKYSCLQYSEKETTSYTNGISNNVSDNCICNLLECRK